MPTTGGSTIYAPRVGLYNPTVAHDFTFGDVIRKARKAKRWSQSRLGEEAKRFPLRADDVKINKSTVSKVETDPYTSEFGTVWRLLAALGLTFADAERRIESPFDVPQEPTTTGKKRRVGV